MKKKPTLSLFMIVKDEEAMLARCLESVQGYVDEMIVVDTGSTDATVDIAKRYGATIHFHPWENDFAKHRNQAMGYATGEWLVMLDADEELRKGCGEILRRAICDNNIEAIDVINVSYFNKGVSQAWLNQTRVFRNRPHIHYAGIVHEQLMGIVHSKRYPIFIDHYGYDLEKDLSARKHARNIRLLKEQIKADPENFFYHLNLAVSYSTHFEFQNAINEGLTALQLAENQGICDHNVLWATYIVSSAYFKLDDLDNAEHYALNAIQISPDHLDAHFILALTYHRKKEWTQLSNVSSTLFGLYESLRHSPEKFGSRLIHMANEEWRIHIGLGDMHLHQKKAEKAIKAFNAGLDITSNRSECYRIIGDCFRNVELWQHAKTYYDSALKEQYDNPEALYGLALIYKNQNNDKQYREIIGTIRRDRVDNPDIFCEMGILNLRDKGYESAIDNFQRAIAINPVFYPAFINLALAYKYLGRVDDALDANLRGLEIRPEATEAIINLGHLYYERGEFNLAKEMFMRSLHRDQKQLDVRLFLCEILIKEQEIEDCVDQCDMILKGLGLPRDLELSSLSDLAGLFILIGNVFNEYERSTLSNKAMQIARQLDPQIEKRLKF